MKKTSVIITAIGVISGAAAGWLYWNYVGCSSGSCSITSKPLNSSLYGAFMGGLFFNIVSGYFTNKKQKSKNT